ncbi:MAG: hypothetical protein M0R46_13570 [Candidatus Muirbacterium halophilum]|nr:hypothetical protein [Candidatus Muirbacterium halophilum]
MNIKETFKLLAQRTHPEGSEHKLLKYLPFLNKDPFGNYYLIIGSMKPTTMFCCHLDTYGEASSINLMEYQDFIFTDGSTILGADDKTGVVLLMYMIQNNVPGLYYFFIKEEIGSIGSKSLAEDNTIDYMSDLKRCIAFDRKGIHSVITHQKGIVSCSEEFADNLIMMYEEFGISLKKDNTGIFCDSGPFIGKMECTNISVGYYNEHTTNEILNIKYLDRLCKASVNINWQEL